MAKHHSLGGSNTYTWLNCPGSRKAIVAAIQAGLIPEESPGNAYTEEGTIAHGLGELCLDRNFEPGDFYNKTIPAVVGKKVAANYLDENEFEHLDINTEVMTSEYIEAVQVYVDYIRESKDSLKNAIILLERSYSLEKYVDDDCGGSADTSLLEMKGLLHISDYKHGKGVVVEAKENPQNRLYGLGALLEHQNKYQFTHVKLSIIQPRAFHSDGPIRSEELSPAKLLRWGKRVVKPAVELLNSDNPELIPGEKQCMWCRVNGICKANAEQALMIAQKDFAEIDLPGDELIEPQRLTIEEATIIINNKKRMEKWLNAVQAYVETAALAGTYIPDHKIVERISNRQYKTNKAIIRRLKRLHPEIDPYDMPKVKSPAQMEAYLKAEYGYTAKDAKALVDQFTQRIKIGVALAPETDGRKAIERPLTTEFKNETNGGEADDVDNFYN